MEINQSDEDFPIIEGLHDVLSPHFGEQLLDEGFPFDHTVDAQQASALAVDAMIRCQRTESYGEGLAIPESFSVVNGDGSPAEDLETRQILYAAFIERVLEELDESDKPQSDESMVA